MSGRLSVRLLEERVELGLVLDNRARNFDLRLVARLAGGQAAFCGAPFGVEERPFEQDHVPQKAAQLNLPDFPLRGWVALQAADGAGWVVLARGLYEAEVARVESGAEIALTLLRGVDFLSRHDLHTRPDHAGPMIATPDAQCIGRQEWELALLPFGPGEADAVPARSEQFLRPAAAFPVQWSSGHAPAEQSLFVGDEALVISALKPGFEDGGVIIHAFNPTKSIRRATVAGERVRLDETLSSGSGQIQPFEVAAWQVKVQ